MARRLDDALPWLGLAGIVGAVIWSERSTIVETVKDVVERGKVLSTSTLDRASGLVLQSPGVLLAEAVQVVGYPMSEDVYALARMIRSEGAAQGLARAHVALNDLRHLGWHSLFYMLTYSTDPSRRGFYGAQYNPPDPPHYPNKGVRRYSTSQDPYQGDVAIVGQAMTEDASGVDPTEGAIKFVDRRSFGSQLGTKTFEANNAAWVADGLEPYSLTAFGEDLVFYRKA